MIAHQEVRNHFLSYIVEYYTHVSMSFISFVLLLLSLNYIINFDIAPEEELNNNPDNSSDSNLNTIDDIPPPVPDAPPSDDIQKGRYALVRGTSHQSHSSNPTVHFADEVASTSSKSKSKKSKQKKPAVPEVPRKPEHLSSEKYKQHRRKSSRSVPPEVPDPPPGDHDGSDSQSRGKKRKAKEHKEESGSKKSKSKGKDASKLALAPVLASVPSDPITESNETIPNVNEGVESLQESQESSEVAQQASGEYQFP